MLELHQYKEVSITLLSIIAGIGGSAFLGAHFQLLKDYPEILKAFRRVGGISFVLAFVLIIFLFNLETKNEESQPVVEKPINLETKNEESQPVVEKPIDFNKFIELLKDEDYTDERFTLLSKHSESIPNQISATDIKRILKRFHSNQERFEVLKILRNLRKLKQNYTEIEKSKIKGMFNNYIWDFDFKVNKWFDGSQ